MRAAVVTAPGAVVSHRLPLDGLAEFLTRDRSAIRRESITVLIDPSL